MVDTNELHRDRLKREAERSAYWHGHSLAPWTDCGPDRARTHCQDCRRRAFVNTRPLPNGIDIGGSAVAMGCLG